jgi:hypothetical protein
MNKSTLWNTKITLCGDNIMQVRTYEKIQGFGTGKKVKKEPYIYLNDEQQQTLDLAFAPTNAKNLMSNYSNIYIENSIKKYQKSIIDVHNKKKNGTKKRNKIINLINSNPQLDTFVTLTFKENIQDFDYAYKCFKKFNRKMNETMNKTGNKFEFVSVIEFQKRGAIHFHVLCNLKTNFNIQKYKKSIKQMDFENQLHDFAWQYGWITVQPIKNVNGKDNNNIGAYMVKYMTKECDNDLTVNEKMTSSSKGLRKPIEIKIWDRNSKNEYDTLGTPNFQSNYYSDFTGNVQFREYNKLNKIESSKSA